MRTCDLGGECTARFAISALGGSFQAMVDIKMYVMSGGVERAAADFSRVGGVSSRLLPGRRSPAPFSPSASR